MRRETLRKPKTHVINIHRKITKRNKKYCLSKDPFVFSAKSNDCDILMYALFRHKGHLYNSIFFLYFIQTRVTLTNFLYSFFEM